MTNFFHSVYLDKDECKGCLNCIKRCPTQAIRVRNKKASINSKFCIDCGECIRRCENHAKLVRRDHLNALSLYKYTIALPAPSLYSQFNNVTDINVILTALINLGFDDVYEVSGAAELVSEQSRKYIEANKDKWPIISSACPSVVRLIRVRFPNLIEHLLPLKPPVEIAAREDIGIFFISPCPAKITYAQAPLGIMQSEIDAVLAIKDVYPLLLSKMKEIGDNILNLSISGKIGIGWGSSGGEATDKDCTYIFKEYFDFLSLKLGSLTNLPVASTKETAQTISDLENSIHSFLDEHSLNDNISDTKKDNT